MDIIKSEPDSDNEIDPLSSHCEFQLVNVKYEDQSEETTFHTPRSESRSSMDIKKEEHDSDTEAHCISSCSEDQLTDMKQEEFLVPVPNPALESETNVKESKRTGAGTQEVYSPRLWNFAYFTDDKDFIRSGTDTLAGTNEEDGNESAVSTRTETQHFQTPQSRKGRTTLRRNQEQILEATQSLLSSKEDEWEIIGKSIGLQLKDLTKYQQTIANKLISDIIFYGKVNKLTKCSSINLSTVIHTPSPSYPIEHHPTIPAPSPSPSYPTTHHPTIPSKSLQSSQATHIQVHIPEDDNDLSVIQ